MIRSGVLGLAALAGYVAPTLAQDQAGADTACAVAQRTLKMVARGESYSRALAVLVGCPAAGPEALAAEWSRPPVDSLGLQALSGVSGMLRDRRVHVAAMSVVLDGSADRPARLAALGVLVRHFDPCLEAAYRTPHHPGLGARAYVWLGESDHDVSREGQQPLPAGVRAEVVATLRRLGANDADEQVRMIAAYLSERLDEKKEPVRCWKGSDSTGLAADEALGQQDPFLPPSVVNTQLDSLEKVALTSGSPDARRAAVTRISAPGWIRSDQPEGPVSPEVRYPGIVARLVRIYQQSDDYWMRYSIIRLLIPQVERAHAIAFLEQVAQEPGTEPAAPPDVALIEDKWSLQALAIGALTRIGPEGEASLRRLHAAGTVRERTARTQLERLAARGFRKAGGS
jgi:hypothetical protein